MDKAQAQTIMQSWKTGVIKWADVIDVVAWLDEHTGKGLENDPFVDPNSTIFRECALLLGSGIKYKEIGIYCFRKYYEKCMMLELESGVRIHKGDMLNWIGRYYYELQRYDEAFYFWILDFLEDTLSEYYKTAIKANVCITDALKAPIAEMLQLHFEVSLQDLTNLHERTCSVLKISKDTVLNPEVLRFKLRHEGYHIPRFIDYRSYHPNIPYLKSTYEKIKATDDKYAWEQFAAFLLSSIDGMEPLTNLKVGGGTYEFDVIIRNCSSIELLRTILGDYIGIECKFYKDESVNVEQIDHFAMKLKYHNIKSGVIFTKNPLSGWKDSRGAQYGKLVQTKIFNRDEIIIFDINTVDIERILKKTNLVELIVEKYETVRLGL